MESPAPSPAQPSAPAAPPSAAAAQAAALAWAHSARFLTTASQLHQLPAPVCPEIAFVGRSNAGKSSAINTLAQHRRLAFSSRTPGRTQHINLFELGGERQVGPHTLWADLPGYGYAAVERAAKLRWQKVMADYLEQRPALFAVVQMVDVRHGLTPLDLQLLQFVSKRVSLGSLKLLVLLTKADKLSRQQGLKALAQVQAGLQDVVTERSDVAVSLFSALKGIGVGDTAQRLMEWLQPPESADLAEAAAAPVPPAPPAATDQG
ncbi:ribosome biogenesis GTP-binding protein YihA/YsxC [Amphibiibacter pelophylacis]|uniref:Ribosome biogenesis GTP-binding protein YihA/YsxC n=1 Tax=Amphibiibacter pelophylacis TaxID=1799477 RepID=A0ACC6NY32_9BURK